MADSETGSGSYRELLETRRRLRELTERERHDREDQRAENTQAAENAQRADQHATDLETSQEALRRDWLRADEVTRQRDASPSGGAEDSAPDSPERPDPVRRAKDQQHQKNIADYERYQREEEASRHRDEARLEYVRQQQEQTQAQQPTSDRQGERDGMFRSLVTQRLDADQRDRDDKDRSDPSPGAQGREQTDRRQSTTEQEKTDKDYEQEAKRTERRDTLIARWQADRARERGDNDKD